MKKLFKRNQLMITALAIMLAIAGYLQFAKVTPTEEGIETNSSQTITEIFTIQDDLFSEIESLDTEGNELAENYLETDMMSALESTDDALLAEGQPEENEVPGEAVFTSAAGIAVLSDAKLAKEQVRSKNKSLLLEIINNTSITDSQKQEAIDTMVEMTQIAEKEAAAELLLQAKGFSDVIVSINGKDVDVVVNALSLSDAQRAQIEDIVKRKTEISADNIIISTVVQ